MLRKILIFIILFILMMVSSLGVTYQKGFTLTEDIDGNSKNITDINNLAFDASGSPIDLNGRLLDDYNSTKPVSCQVISRAGMYLLFNETGYLINQTDDFGKLAMRAYETAGINKLDIGYGTFYCNTSINQSKYRYKQMIFEGQGYTGTVIAKDTGLTGPIFDCRFNGTTNSDWRGMEIKHLGIDGVDKTVDGVRLNFTVRTKVLDSVKIYNCNNGLILDDFCILNSFENSYFRDNNIAIKLTYTKFGANIANSFERCMANDNVYGLILESASDNTFEHMELEGNDIGNLLIHKISTTTTGPKNNIIAYSYLEDTAGQYNVQIRNGTNTTGPACNLLLGNTFALSSSSNIAVNVSSGYGNAIKECLFGGAASSTAPYTTLIGSNAAYTRFEYNKCEQPYNMLVKDNGVGTIKNSLNITNIPNEMYPGFAGYANRIMRLDSANRTGLSVSGGTLSYPNNGTILLTATSTEPYITINTYGHPGQFMRYVYIKYKYVHGTPADFSYKIRYVTAGHGISDSYYFMSTLKGPSYMSGWIDRYADMYILQAGGSDWKTSDITSIRINFGCSSGATIALTEISLIGIVP